MPTGRDIPLLLGGIIGIGMSGPLIALSAMPILVLIFWRNLGGAILMAPFALRAKQYKSAAERRAIGWSALAGFFLALHFIGFFIAMRFTSVAAGVALTALQPIFAAVYIRFLGGHIPTKAWLGMAISFAGVLVITGVDLTISFRAFLGDLAAIACAALSALYVLIGAKAQRTINTSTYTTVCYATCAITALPLLLLVGDPLFDFPQREWLLLIALILGSQILGHTMFNFSLKRVSPTVVSLIVFFEVPIGALFAWWWIDQIPPAGTIPGIIVLLLGCALFVTRRESR
ncbi:MAG: EamA family transporter [Actinobacteria bacterium]|jgi:drug/metabolite transporter (DMT)-like permease|nr:EamA family transporter [Actinomycetota bacterium]